MARQLASLGKSAADIEREAKISLPVAEASMKEPPLAEGSPQARCAWEVTLSLVVNADKHNATTKKAIKVCKRAEETKEQMKEVPDNPAATWEQIAEAEQVIRAAQAICDEAHEDYRWIPHEADGLRAGDRIKAPW